MKNRTAKGKTRVTATITDVQLAKLDEVSARTGLSRSAVVSFLVTTGLESYEMFLGLPEEKMKVVVSALKDAEASV